jgi:HTH-type transcriptional regulator / antitoxin HigA
MTVNTQRTLPDTYFQLVKQFPLTHIKDDAHAEAAQEMIDQLLQKDLDPGEQAYMDVLTDLFEAYEDAHVPISDAAEADVLLGLMTSNGLTQSALAQKVGMSQSTISAVLNSSRSLTKEQVVKLAKFFHVAPGAFLPS